MIQTIIAVLLFAALAYAWYTERERRLKAEADHELTKSRVNLDELNQRLKENQAEYDAALNAVPASMLDNIGKPTPSGRQASLVADSRNGKIIDTATGQVVGDAKPVQPVFKDLPAAGSLIDTVQDGS